jgi:hypothetical protein
MAVKDCDLQADATRIRHRRSKMNRMCTALICTVLAAAALMVAGAPAPVLAAPPTVVPSPGYDARLQDSRKAATAASPAVVDPAPSSAPTAPRHHTKKKQ